MSKKTSATFTTRDRSADPYNISAAPQDPETRAVLRERLIQLSVPQLKARLQRQISENRVTSFERGDRDMGMITRLLDTGGASTGNVLPRVDLEQTIYSLFVR